MSSDLALSSSDSNDRSVQTSPHVCSSESDFISFAATAQRCQVDLLPITWQPALGIVGSGGFAEISQALMNVQMSFAFKRVLPRRQHESTFSRLETEISVLSHPRIRHHPNIINLEGICWEFDINQRTWPVLVFEKMERGDLFEFLKTTEGEALSLQERIELCSDVAHALMAIHSTCKMSRCIIKIPG